MTEATQAPLGDDVALQELVDQVNDLNGIVDQIVRLRSDGFFRYLSKQSRNTLLHGLLEKSADVHDAAKAAFRTVKKIKRERLPEEIADLLLAGNRQTAMAAAPLITGKAPETDADAS